MNPASMQHLRLLTVVTIAALAAACAAVPPLPGQVETVDPAFGGHVEVHLSPGVVDSPGTPFVLLNLGARWSSSAPDRVVLIAQVPRQAREIRAEGGLQLEIDGEVFTLDSATVQTEIETGLAPRSRRPFNVELSFAERLAGSENVRMRLLVGEAEYYEGRLEDGANTAYRGLRRFVEAVHEVRARPVGEGQEAG